MLHTVFKSITLTGVSNFYLLRPILVVQVGDLQYASPATVSRAGMVYVDPKNLGYMPYWQRWLTQLLRPEEEKEALAGFFDVYVSASIALIHEGLSGLQQVVPLRTIIPQTPLNMVSYTISISAT